MWRRATNVAWWLGISLYFGGLLAIGMIAAPAIRDAAKNAGLIMPGVASPPLEMYRQVTGQIFGEVLTSFTWIEVVALGFMLIGIAGYLLAHRPVRRTAWILLLLWATLVALLGYDAAVLRPKVFDQRAAMWTTAPAYAAEKDLAKWPEKVQFDRLHKQSETLGRTKAYLLLGMILVTAWRGLAEKPVKPVAASPHPPAARGELMREV